MSNDPSGEGVVTTGVKSAIESEPGGRRVETGRGEEGGEMVVGSVVRARPQRTEVECVDGGMENGRCGVRRGRRKVWAAVEMGEATLDRQVTG